ncbi:MAG: hypothetical protein JXR48_13275 [Candidatus Delongbacteria bacterium]|nr:hypothetical protein [Candidatus Delongbacteria bacterium]MBN2835926.1 hypothetical protein [Candidatus Delongbacteria bacterium]
MTCKIESCNICGKDIVVGELFYSLTLTEKVSYNKGKLLKGEEFELYTVCKNCSQNDLLKNIILTERNSVSISSDQKNDKDSL